MFSKRIQADSFHVGNILGAQFEVEDSGFEFVVAIELLTVFVLLYLDACGME